MPHADQTDQVFALLEDEDIDFRNTHTATDVPVLTYRWSKNDATSRVPLNRLIEIGKQVMEELGLRRVVSEGRHVRADTADQRIKMTVLKSGRRSMYLLMTAGMPGAREKAKTISRKIAQRLDERIGSEQCDQDECRDAPA